MKLDTKIKYAEIYNTSHTVLVVASYPDRTNRSIKEIDAVASYTDHLCGAFAKELAARGKKLVVFAQKIYGKEEWYIERDILVIRVWGKGSLFAYLHILTNLLFFTKVKTTLIQFEFHQFGGNTTTVAFPLFLFLLKTIGKTVSLVMHQVVMDITDLSGHVNIKKSSVLVPIFTFALRMFYKLTSRIADTVTVHSAILAQRLKEITGRNDINVIPHGLEALQGICSKSDARKKLGIPKSDFVIMSFGFLTWYKGSDWIVDEFSKHKKAGVQLIMAGGESPNLKDKPYYQKFVTTIKTKAAGKNNITITGFVDDEQIPLYFAAADLVALPYRTLMSASGPLAMTISFEKPFIMSNALMPYTEDTDFTYALAKTGVSLKDLCFPLHSDKFWQSIVWTKTNQKQLTSLSTLLKTSRTWGVVSKRLCDYLEDAGFSYQKKSDILESESYVSYAPSHS